VGRSGRKHLVCYGFEEDVGYYTVEDIIKGVVESFQDYPVNILDYEEALTKKVKSASLMTYNLTVSCESFVLHKVSQPAKNEQRNGKMVKIKFSSLGLMRGEANCIYRASLSHNLA